MTIFPVLPCSFVTKYIFSPPHQQKAAFVRMLRLTPVNIVIEGLLSYQLKYRLSQHASTVAVATCRHRGNLNEGLNFPRAALRASGGRERSYPQIEMHGAHSTTKEIYPTKFARWFLVQLSLRAVACSHVLTLLTTHHDSSTTSH